MKKKLQKPKKKHSTYRPKYAEKPASKKQVGSGGGDEILQRPDAFKEKVQFSEAKLPESYNPPGSEAYRFPSYGYVAIVVVILIIIGYLLF